MSLQMIEIDEVKKDEVSDEYLESIVAAAQGGYGMECVTNANTQPTYY